MNDALMAAVTELVGRRLPADTYQMDDASSPSYQDYVDMGVFAPMEFPPRPARSTDRSFIGLFGQDWAQGRPDHEIGPSGTDEEHSEEVGQWTIWQVARGLRSLEAAGAYRIPSVALEPGALKGDFIPALLDATDAAIRAAKHVSRGDLVVQTQDGRVYYQRELEDLGSEYPGRAEATLQAFDTELARVRAAVEALRGEDEPTRLHLDHDDTPTRDQGPDLSP